MDPDAKPTRKRRASDQDPDYEDVEEHQKKRQKLIEATGKEATISKIQTILHRHFSAFTKEKEAEICELSQHIMDAKRMLDRLRACILGSYYSVEDSSSQDSFSQSAPLPIHPSVKKSKGKHPKNGQDKENTERELEAMKKLCSQNEENTLIGRRVIEEASETAVEPPRQAIRGKDSKAKSRIIVGNISRYIPIEKREENDPSTHKWMVYVRGPKEAPQLKQIVKEIWFFLHPSYRPNDLVIVREYPYHLTRRGWGEFPVRVQIHFQDSRNKQVDIIHHLKLDRTYTGLQTMGAETLVDIQLEGASNSNGIPSKHTADEVSTSVSTSNGEAVLDIKLEATTQIEKQHEKLISPSQIKREPDDVSKATITPREIQIKQEPVESVEEPVSFEGLVPTSTVSTPKKGSKEPGWIQFQICGENVTPTKSKPPTPKSSPKAGWTNISDLTKGEKKEKSKLLAVPVSSNATSCTSVSMLSLGKGALSTAQQPSKGGPVLATMIGSPQGVMGGRQNQLKLVGPGLKVSGPGSSATSTSSAPTQLVYVKCIDKSGMALLTPKQVQSNTGIVPFNSTDILLKVTPPVSSKPDGAKVTKAAVSAAGKPPVTLSALPKNTTLVYCSSKVSPQQHVAVASPQGSKKGSQFANLTPTGNLALAKTGQYFVQYPATAVQSHSSIDTTSILRPKLTTASSVLQTVALPTARPGGVGNIQNVILTKPGTGKSSLQSILTTPPQPGTSKDLKQSPTIAIVVSSPGTYVLGKPISQKSQADCKTVITNAVTGGKSSIMVKSAQQFGKTVSLLRPGLIQTKVGSSAIQMSGKAMGLPASSIPVGIGPGQIALITTSTTTTNSLGNQSAQLSVTSSGPRKANPGAIVGSKTQPSLLYIVPTSSANYFKPSDQAGPVTTFKPVSQPIHSILGASKRAKQAVNESISDQDETYDNFGIKKFDITDMGNMEQLVKYVVKRFPLVSANRHKFGHPYCASEQKEFLGWNIAKQRAAEWTRACSVRRVIWYLMGKYSDPHFFRGEPLWKRRQIVLWCRKNGFTPMMGKVDMPSSASRYLFSLKSHSSLSNYMDILSKLEQVECKLVKPAVSLPETDEIDILCENNSMCKPLLSTITDNKTEALSDDTCKDRTELDSHANIIGDILMRVTEAFVEDLVRGTTSNMHEEGLFPAEIGARDIFMAMKKMDICDFLTNKCMGLISE